MGASERPCAVAGISPDCCTRRIDRSSAGTDRRSRARSGRVTVPDTGCLRSNRSHRLGAPAIADANCCFQPRDCRPNSVGPGDDQQSISTALDSWRGTVITTRWR